MHESVVWLKWTYPADESLYFKDESLRGKTTWSLVDISLYELKTVEWKGHYRQYLQYSWSNENGHGTEEIDLKDYPRLSSKEHLIMLCNIERPYVPCKEDVIELSHDEKKLVHITVDV